MSKTVKTYLPDDLAALVNKKAKTQNLSLSSYIQSLIRADTKKQRNSAAEKDEAEDSPGSADDKIRITVTGKDALLLKEKSCALGISPTAWVRNSINTNTFTVVNFSMDDMDKFLKTYEQHVSHIGGILGVCVDTQKVFPQDLENILDIQEELRDLFKEMFLVSYRTRQSMFRHLVKKYEGRDLDEH